jgi:hypothetical protein
VRPAVLPQPTTLVGVARKPCERVRERAHVARWYQQSARAVLDNVGDTTHIGRNHRAARCHGLDQGHRRAFVPGCERHDIHCGVDLGQIVAPARKHDALAQAATLHIARDRRPELAVPDDKEDGRTMRCGQLGKGFNQPERLFDGNETPNEADHQRVCRESERRAGTFDRRQIDQRFQLKSQRHDAYLRRRRDPITVDNIVPLSIGYRHDPIGQASQTAFRNTHQSVRCRSEVPVHHVAMKRVHDQTALTAGSRAFATPLPQHGRGPRP